MRQQDESLSISTLLVLALTAVVPIGVATGFSNFERPRQFVLAAMAAVALASWGIGLVRRKRSMMASPGTVALGAGFAVMIVASLMWSGVSEFGALSVIGWIGLGVVFLVLVAPVGRRASFLDWATAAAAGAIGAGALGMYELFGGEGLVVVWEPVGIAGGFDSIQFAAAYYAVVIPVLVGATAVSSGIRRGFLALALLLSILHFGLIIDAPTFGVVAASMFVVAIGTRPWKVAGEQQARDSKLAAALGVIAMGTLVAGIVAFELPDESTAAVDLPRLDSTGSFVDDADERGNYWYFAADRTASPVDFDYHSYLDSVTRGLWQNEPLLGYGAGGWWLMQTDVVDDSDDEFRTAFNRYPAFRSPHSDYRRILVEQGGLGLALFLLWLAGLGCAAVAGWRRNDGDDGRGRLIAWALGSSVLCGMVAMSFVPLLELVSSGVVWVGAAAMMVGHAARHGGEGQWLETVEFGDAAWFRWSVAALTVVTAAAMLIPSTQHARSALDRGWADHNMLRADYEAAIDLYEQAHERYPAHAEVLYNIALGHHLLGDTPAGENAIHDAVEMRPYDSRILTHAAGVEIRERRIRPALEYAREAVRTGPSHVRAYDVYVAALQWRQRNRDAATVLKTFLERDPPSEEQKRVRPKYAEILIEELDDHEGGLEQLRIAADAMSPSYERNLIMDRIEEVEKTIERLELQEQGEPIPPELEPQPDDHDHDHGPFHHH